MPPLIPIVIAGIEAAIQAAPGIIDVVEKGKALIASLFGAGIISADQQNTLHAHIDQHAADVAAGKEPVSWTVEPDPPSPTNAPPPTV